ncbi:unnamed protein product, partial [Ilex paraguariensis]
NLVSGGHFSINCDSFYPAYASLRFCNIIKIFFLFNFKYRNKVRVLQTETISVIWPKLYDNPG